ncbi:MAG: anti-sigma factor family protein [Thermodesulfobacteriota bacterium]
MKNSCLSPKLLERYFDQETSPQEKGLVENHLLECSSCQKRLNSMGVLREAIKKPVEEALEKETFPWVWEKIEREIRKEHRPSWWESFRLWLVFTPILQRKVWIPVLATFMVLLFATAQIFLKKIPSHLDGSVVKYVESADNDVMVYHLEKQKVTVIWVFEEPEKEFSDS